MEPFCLVADSDCSLWAPAASYNKTGRCRQTRFTQSVHGTNALLRCMSEAYCSTWTSLCQAGSPQSRHTSVAVSSACRRSTSTAFLPSSSAPRALSSSCSVACACGPVYVRGRSVHKLSPNNCTSSIVHSTACLHRYHAHRPTRAQLRGVRTNQGQQASWLLCVHTPRA